jgi:hypothetical protein
MILNDVWPGDSRSSRFATVLRPSISFSFYHNKKQEINMIDAALAVTDRVYWSNF